jgi:hypothetical protein
LVPSLGHSAFRIPQFFSPSLGGFLKSNLKSADGRIRRGEPQTFSGCAAKSLLIGKSFD